MSFYFLHRSLANYLSFSSSVTSDRHHLSLIPLASSKPHWTNVAMEGFHKFLLLPPSLNRRKHPATRQSVSRRSVATYWWCSQTSG